MASYDIKELQTVYEYFTQPISKVTVNEKVLSEIKTEQFKISDIEVNLTCGFEAGMATFIVGNVYDNKTGKFNTDAVKRYFPLGSSVTIALGYGQTVRDVFTGFISQVNFQYAEKDIPVIKITAMDVKGIMMAGRYNNQLKALNYGDAVKEIFEKTSFKALQSQNLFGKISVADTPDKKEGGQQTPSALTMEMVGESDYEFVVRAAKKFNYEFFCTGNEVVFRKAFGESDALFTLSNAWHIKHYDVESNMTGLVQNIEVRGVDVGRGEVITASKKVSNKISLASKAKSLIDGSVMVVRDPTVNSKEDAKNRLEFLEYDIYSRLGYLDTQFVGIPEIIPGRFMNVEGLTQDFAPEYYIKSVTHTLRTDEGFLTRVEGFTPTLDYWNPHEAVDFSPLL